MLRLVGSLCALATTLAACGSEPVAQPDLEAARRCGELEGVERVDPVIVGAYPNEIALETTGSCPMFAPVPCTEPWLVYQAFCGEGCFAQTAVTPDGDTWVVGCAADPGAVGCGGPDFSEIACARDPYQGNPYWFWFTECQAPFVPYYTCWNDCDGAPIGEPADWCPEP